MNKFKFTVFAAIISYYIFFPAFSDLYTDIRVNSNYRETYCTVLAKGSPSTTSSIHKPAIQVSYVVDNKTYQTWASALHTHPVTYHYDTAVKLLDRYHVKESVPCWYDPSDPNLVAMDKGYDRHNLMLLCGSLLLLFLFTFPFVFIYYTDKQAVISSKVSGQYKINNKFFLIEYVYLGDRPITVQDLPRELPHGSQRLKESLVMKINTNGKIVALNKTFMIIVCMCILATCAAFSFYEIYCN